MSKFQELYNVDVKEHVETRKQGGVELSYLSWAYAWYHIKLIDDNATYQIHMFDGKPYVKDQYGIMVFTSMTVNGLTYDMWLPVMDGSNKAMKDEPYEYVNSKGETRRVESATMFDINKTIMRCLVKNIAMFGLGLKLYAGEDLPDSDDKQVTKPLPFEPMAKPTQPVNPNLASGAQKEFMFDLMKKKGKTAQQILQIWKIDVHDNLTKRDCTNIIEYLKSQKDVPQGSISTKDVSNSITDIGEDMTDQFFPGK